MIINPSQGKALSKVMMAAAWIDGDLHKHERKVIEQFMNRFSTFDEEDRASVWLYGEYPMCRHECEMAIQQLVPLLNSKALKDLSIVMLDAVIQADETVTDAEQVFLTELKNIITHGQQWESGLLSRSLDQSHLAHNRLSKNFNRESKWLYSYLFNIVSFRFQMAYYDFNLPIELSPKMWEIVALETSLIVEIYMQDKVMSDTEIQKVESYLISKYKFGKDLASILVAIAVHEKSTKGSILKAMKNLPLHYSFEATDALYADLVKLFREEDLNQMQIHTLQRIANDFHIDPEES